MTARGTTEATGNLSDTYIGTPKGSDPRHAGVVIDGTGQPYVAIGDHYYAVRNDPANGTWRAVQLQDPVKPGIPIRRDAAGNWRPHGDVGMPGGRPIPTRDQVQHDLHATEALLHELTVRRINQRQDIFDLRDMLREYETFQQETHADLHTLRSQLDLSQGMAEYFARQIERGNPEPSFRTQLEARTREIEATRGAMRGLQQLNDQVETYIGIQRSRIAAKGADLEHTKESILRARTRMIELERLSGDVE